MKRFLLLFLLLSVALLAPLQAQQPDPGFGRFRNVAVTSTAVAVKASNSNVFGYTFINPNTTAVYVKFYNAQQASTVVGTTAPQCVIMVPPGDATTPGVVYLAADTVSYQFFNLAVTIAVVTGRADNSTAAPGTAIYVEVLYK